MLAAFHNICGAFACIALSTIVCAADPELRQLQPQGAQRGTEVEVKFRGVRLADQPEQILFYEPGIEAVAIEAIDDKKVKCRLSIEEDCRLGPHALRLRTSSGLTNLVTFHVGDLKEVNEAEPNNSSDEPQTIANEVVVNGVVNAGDIDVFAVEVTEGERLSVEIEGIRLGRTLFDPLIELRDERGQLLATSDDQPAARQDAFVSILPTESGKLFVLVREAAFRGSNAATYRLHVGRFPRPVGVFPPAAVSGSTAQLRWIGQTFGDSTVPVEISATDDHTYQVHATDEGGVAPTGMPLLLCDQPPTLEIEPNNKLTEPNEIPAPGVACGVISEPEDRDFYRFTMKKGEEWDFRVRARELRSPLDSVIHIFSPDGKYLKGNDDDRGKPDSYIRFKAPQDGEYTLDVEDRLKRGRPEMTYALEIKKPVPTAHLTLDERQRYRAQVINIPRGGRAAAMMTVRRSYIGGPMQVEFADLPQGSNAAIAQLAANYHRIPLLFSAKDDAPLRSQLASVVATPTNKPTAVESPFRQQTWLVRGRNNVEVWSHYADRPAVTVAKQLPYDVRIVEPKAPLVQGGSMELKLVATRKEGFDNSIGVRTLYNPPGVSTNQSRSITKNKTEVLVPMTANNKASVGEWKIVFLGRTNMNGAVECATQLATLKIAEPYFDVKRIPSLTLQRGETVDMTVAVDQRHEFSGDAKVKLLRLPTGVTAGEAIVRSDSETADFQLKVADDARLGRHRGVGCQVELTVEGEPVRYSQGYVDMFVDPAPKTKTAANQKTREDQAS
ncbi:MAG: PPC domain-containing protein [Planctomycetota bacterium]